VLRKSWVVEAQLALGGRHAGERREMAFALEFEEGLAVAVR